MDNLDLDPFSWLGIVSAIEILFSENFREPGTARNLTMELEFKFDSDSLEFTCLLVKNEAEPAILLVWSNLGLFQIETFVTIFVRVGVHIECVFRLLPLCYNVFVSKVLLIH